MKKIKLSITEQIEHMKNKGITFHELSQEEAAMFLENNTYYFKLKAYARNYDKFRDPEKNGEYIHLDFAYLKDLSTIDAHLRKIIFKMSLDLEHFLKVKMLRDFVNGSEDGYHIVDRFFQLNPNLKKEIFEKQKSSTCSALINKNKEEWALWNIVEVLSFRHFIDLYQLFYSIYPSEKANQNMLMSVRLLRNAAAHNNCLINQLRPPFEREITPNRFVYAQISKIPGIKNKTLSKKMTNPIIHDFIVLLFVYYEMVESNTRKKGFEEIYDFFSKRMVRHGEYYKSNEVLTSSYRFTKKVIDFFYEKSI